MRKELEMGGIEFYPQKEFDDDMEDKSDNDKIRVSGSVLSLTLICPMIFFLFYFSLESDPCLVCNNPEVPFTSLKLSNLKVDTKYTTTTQIVKLASSHSISKISLRIGDLKRTKMVRTVNIFFNNRSVQAVVELKNRPTVWHKAKKVSLTAG